MRVLVLGSGGREHALMWKLARSTLAPTLFCAPGNPGTAALGTNLSVDLASPADVVRVATQMRADLVVVGPELPLVTGAADVLRGAGFIVFGPGAAAAQLEGSKAFAKEVMAAAKVPTSAFQTFTELGPAEAYAEAAGRIVVKADGLAGGKGVVVAQSPAEAVAAVRSLHALSAPAGGRLVLEEVLEGEEVSVIALCDGARYVLLPAAQDHKRIFDGDLGPNTGGMGAYAPVARLTPEALAQVGEDVIAPVLREMAGRGSPFEGALYAGLMMTERGPRVLEFNVRLGDPEAQVLMLQLGEDLLPLLLACAERKLQPRALVRNSGVSVGVVLAAQGYPSTLRLGDPIEGIDQARLEGVEVFQAGTARQDGRLVTGGGRVLTVCASADGLVEARARAYAAADRISFEGKQLRRDIGARGLSSR